MKRFSSMQSVVVMAMTLFSGLSWGQTRSLPMSVNTSVSGENAVSAPASGMVTRSGNSNIVFRINNSCFPTNLRGVANPLARTSTVDAKVVVVIGGKEYTLHAKYPGMIVMAAGLTGAAAAPNPTVTSIPAGATGAIYGNSMIFNTPFPTTVSVGSSGQIVDADKGDVYLKQADFSQEVTCTGKEPLVYGNLGWSGVIGTNCSGDFMGKSGTLTASIGGLNVSSDKTNIELNVSFPGETAFCGGYWSPLMVFFDDERPLFQNVTSFPLNPFGKTYWPEKDHTGYFVAIDRDHSGMIDKKDELFGDNGQIKNGFEVLKEFDTNLDGFIDRRDKDFDKLVLWKDKNGDGIAQADEIIKLSKKIAKISLKYNEDLVIPRGAYAEERQRSKFWYKNAKGRLQKGDIIDIWFAPFVDMKVTQK